MNAGDLDIIDDKILYKGFFTVHGLRLRHRLFEGGWSSDMHRELVQRSNAVAVLPYDPVQDKVVLLEQFRVGALNDPQSPWLVEIVAGLINPNETVENVAHRESTEEAGLTLLALKKVHSYWVSPGGSSEFLTIFCGKVDATHAGGVYGLREEHEDIKVLVMSSEEAFQAINTGAIRNAASIVALQWLQLNKDKLRTEWLANDTSHTT